MITDTFNNCDLTSFVINYLFNLRVFATLCPLRLSEKAQAHNFNIKRKGHKVAKTQRFFIFQNYYLTPLFLASMLNVACGTARKRSFGISFPVSRHTP